ncbi:PREDICTED: histone-lysine N-methyltransferase, H3 lysine-9 specific SUVH5-like [Prunus mume]|uniref:Histone-lysine N-methyltransferase, H3 lysine-9 specific SUVH5-like n=1 Tax=Prunus mume TaxID=102107 RepID=A0ABM1LQJ6_PRUMU|nr:PREDICTED: histone-lysine N-methyltransferase, H3 lysine-9 specific SUVH5-like [Prunus mume]
MDKTLEKRKVGVLPNRKRPRVDDEDGVIHHVKEALDEYRETLSKLLQKHDSESYQQVYWRPDIEAAMCQRKKGNLVNTRKQLGPIPGVKVGDEFRNRAELTVVGLHHNFRHGIEYMKKDGKILATSIVNSGRYANHVASPDILTYSGEGGNPRVDPKKPKDQRLERGNLALKNSMEEGTHVRVIRGINRFEVGTRAKKSSFRTYVYDGLYIVESFWQEREEFGKLVFKFLLKRISGQPIIIWGYCPIRVVNAVDRASPPAFNYICNVIYPDFFKATRKGGCDCLHGCLESKSCPCVMKIARVLSYNNTITGTKSLIYECGIMCKCSSSCKNRISQHGIQFKLEVFRTKSKGWGVRSRSYIPQGSFICEYVGEILQDKQVKQRRGFVIDATRHGNVGRFVSHSCSPNLFARSVLHDHDDARIPHMMLFAEKNIPPNQELTYDYNFIVGGSNGTTIREALLDKPSGVAPNII